MKIGDIVMQGDRVIEFKGRQKSRALGVVVEIHEDPVPAVWPEDWKEKRSRWSKMLGRRIDVLWGSGKLSKNFAENSLEVICDELTDEQLELVAGGMGKEAFDLWRAEVINEGH
ncbi:MAG TPA: hypothetical protein EYQ00_05435 [Dehalococcoidia bacterium]|jgi:hypothetical protein|nr:hypothetical protein [Dehalococcoidia bacterium]